MGSAMQGMTGNWGMSLQHKSSAAAARANARIAQAQGKAQKAQAYGQALRTEAENKVAGQQASDAMARLRGQENKAVGSIQAARGASGLTSQGSGMQPQISVMKQFEQQAQDMAYSRRLQDQSAQFSAAMARKSGDLAEMAAEANAGYENAQAGIYGMMARNANRAGNFTAIATGVGAALGGALGGAAGMKAFAGLGSSIGAMYGATKPGTMESTYGLSDGQMKPLGAELSDFLTWLT